MNIGDMRAGDVFIGDIETFLVLSVESIETPFGVEMTRYRWFNLHNAHTDLFIVGSGEGVWPGWTIMRAGDVIQASV